MHVNYPSTTQQGHSKRLILVLVGALCLLLSLFALLPIQNLFAQEIAGDANHAQANAIIHTQASAENKVNPSVVVTSSWTTNGPADATVWQMAIDPTTPTTVYAATSLGIYKSTDGGGSWVTTPISGFSGNPVFVSIDPLTPTTVYASREGDLHKSTDGGANWSALTGPAPTFHRAITVDPSTPQTLYVGIRGGQSVYKSTDGGATWNSVYPGSSFVADTIVVDPNNPNTVYAGGGSPSLFKSTDGGANWTNISSGLTGVSVRSLDIDPTNANIIYVGLNGTNGGVFKSIDGGATWSASNNGLSPTDVYPVVVDKNNPSKLYAGTFGGGVFESNDGGANWTANNTGLTNSTFALT